MPVKLFGSAFLMKNQLNYTFLTVYQLNIICLNIMYPLETSYFLFKKMLLFTAFNVVTVARHEFYATYLTLNSL